MFAQLAGVDKAPATIISERRRKRQLQNGLNGYGYLWQEDGLG
jgi:hypothetical protein